MEKSKNTTVVYFHSGRGGRFNNSGHKTFNGLKDIQQVLNICDSSNRWSFLKDRDEKGHFCSPYYADQNGNYLISEKEVATGVGSLSWDNDYDTDTCSLLSECDANELNIILESKEWGKEDVVVEFFNECTDLIVDWSKFNGDYAGLVSVYFNYSIFDIEYFYNPIEEFEE